MSGLAGLGNMNLRLVGAPDPDMPDPVSVIIDSDAGLDVPEFDTSGNVVQIKHGDGEITVSLDGKPIQDAGKDSAKLGWFSNLVTQIDHDELSRITEDLLRGIQDDLDSRQEWIEDRALGIKLLGLKIEIPNTQGAADGAPVEGMSKVRHPLLLEAVLRFQANARAELLPTDGPVKIRNDSTSDTLNLDQLATALEIDMNHYLTAVATEYYPDTDRMLLKTGFGGDGFKKVYPCPLRNRPVSESVDANDLIVNQSATDLQNAQRVTHRIMMKPSTVKRMQIIGAYRDIELSDAIPKQLDALKEEEKAQQGISVNINGRPEDREREIYEVACELNIKGFEHKNKSGTESGLEIPYLVTIDVSSRQALAVVRNYDKSTEKLPIAKKRFVKYPFVPGLGFYDIGLVHILGNTTNAVTAAWREMLDCGMFASFPGFLFADSGGRQNTNIFRVPPGGGAPIKTGGLPIKEAVMPLPYQTQGMPATMQLVENMVETGRRIGGTAEVQVGEGRADVPVGTTLAMIDQAVKVMNAVHKRMHSAQAEEFQLLKQLFKEDPESFYRHGCKSKTPWDKAKFIQALDSCELVPQADPNTSSAGHRMMKIVGMMQLMGQAPQLYDPIKVHSAALQAMGWSNPDEFFVPPAARANPPPQLIQAQQEMANQRAETQAKVTDSQARAQLAAAKVAESQAKITSGHFEKPGAEPQDTPGQMLDLATAKAKILDAHTRAKEVNLKARDQQVEDQNRDQDRDAKMQDAAVGLAKDILSKTEGAAPHTAGRQAVDMIHQIDKGLSTPQ